MSHVEGLGDQAAGDAGVRFAHSVKQSARMAGVSVSYLYEEMAEGRLRFLKVGRRRLIRPDDLLEWLESHRVAA